MPVVYDGRGGLFIDARVAEHDAARFILDTGASRSTLSPEYTRRLGLEARPGESIVGTAGTAQAETARAQLAVQGVAPVAVDFAVYDFGTYDPQCVGIVGEEILCQAPFQVRYRAQQLVWNGRVPQRRIEMRLDGGVPRIGARVQGVPVDLRLDTGATMPPSPTYYVNLTREQATRARLEGEPVEVFRATGTGGATLELQVFRLQRFELGGLPLSPAFAVVQPPTGYFAKPDAVGFLGNSVLDKLDPYFDYEQGIFAFGA